MEDFSKTYRENLAKLWDKYVKNGETLPEKNIGVRDFIFDSWKRCQSYGINPSELKGERLSLAEIQKLQEKHEKLIFTAHSYLQHLYRFVRGSNFILALSDVDGYVMDFIGDDDMIKSRARKSGLIIGGCRREEYAGTNGIGTCLKEGRAVQIRGMEHFCQAFHNYVCSAAPIMDENEQLVGCLSVVGPLEFMHNHTLAMVSASADGIEKELKMKRAYDDVAAANSQMYTAIQAIPLGVLMIDHLGVVTQHNRKVSELLGIAGENLSGKSLASLINLRASTMDLTDVDRDVQNGEINIVTRKDLRLSLNLSASVIRGERGEKRGTVLVMEELKKLHRLTNDISGFTATYTFDSILGESAAIETVKKIARMAAKSSANVLVLGESGTGKELLAQSIHNASPRSEKPFIAINCGSLPKGLVESELYGYEKGAFTGANNNGHPGKFELADGGTIFLDEIGDMPLELQTSLLRVLENKEIVRIGGGNKKEVDVRIIAATNTDLREAVRKKEFREDLYYRLNVLYVEIPPLRDRPEDISFLADHFIRYQNSILGKEVRGIEDEALEKLRDYHWPGNIRELENSIERAMNLTQADMLTLDFFPSVIAAESKPSEVSESDRTETYSLLVEALKQERGNVSRVSERLNIPKRTLYRRIRKYQIDVDDYRFL